MVNQKISKIAQKLWEVDVNRLEYNVDYKVNLQKSCHPTEKHYTDKCDEPLFSALDEDKMFSIPTYKKLFSLLDNYVLETKRREELTDKEFTEENEFLNACLETRVMDEAFEFMREEGIVESKSEYKDLLWNFWFEFYSRSETSDFKDSSAFEHVFVGEQKGEHDVLGCHNWMQYYFLEKKGLIDYYGYVPEQTEYSDECPTMLAIRFIKNGVVKSVGGFLLGVSPEFEIALYSIVFFCSGQKTRVNFANMEIQLNCFKMERGGEKVLATIFASKN